MDTTLAVLLGAILGGFMKLVFDGYQRKQDRKGVAAAIAGEISATIHSANATGLPVYFKTLSQKLKTRTPPAPPWAFYDTSAPRSPVAEAYMGRAGQLGSRLAQRVGHWHSTMGAIRLELKIVAAGAFDHNPAAAALRIDGALALWDVAEREGQRLVSDLMALSD